LVLIRCLISEAGIPATIPRRKAETSREPAQPVGIFATCFTQRVELERSVRDFLRRAEAWAVTQQPRKQNSRSDASEECNKGEPPVSSGNCGDSRDRVVVVGPAYSFLNHQEIPTSLLWFQTKI
jgi:hypothetical protein